MSQCTIINAHITDQVLQLSNLPRIASGSKNALQIRCNFCGKWDGCGTVAVFYRDESNAYHVPVIDGLVTVPWEVLVDEGFFWFGFMGQDDLTRTTEVIRIEVAKGALTVATATPQDPTPNIYQQIMARHSVLEARFNEAIAAPISADPSATFETESPDGFVRVKISTNGFAAHMFLYIESGVGDFLAEGNPTYNTDYIIPAEYAPLGRVSIKDPAYPGLAIYTSTDPNSGRARVSITGAPLTFFSEDATYALASPSLPELSDARVNYDGSVTYDLAGDGVRVAQEQAAAANQRAIDNGDLINDAKDDISYALNEISALKKKGTLDVHDVEGYALAVSDEDGNVAFAVGEDGKVDFAGLDEIEASAYDAKKTADDASKEVLGVKNTKLDKIETNEYAFAVCDEEGNVAFGIKPDGEGVGNIPDQTARGKLKPFATTDEYAYAVCDEYGQVVFAITHEGEVKHIGRGAGGTISAAFDYTKCGLPVLELDGDAHLMTPAKNEVTLNYTLKTAKGVTVASGTCGCKFQGSSSVSRGYPKYNYTIKFDTAFEAADVAGYDKEKQVNAKQWGAQKKYCMKANWIDPSAARNVGCAKLWGQVVASRDDLPSQLAAAPNYGAIDGFPVVIAINGSFTGLYTFNIPKDGWQFNMGDGDAEYVVCGESNSELACAFYKEADFIDDGEATTDFSIEYAPDDVEDDTVIASFNDAIRAVMNAPNSEDWEAAVAPYIDIDSAIDYYIFVCCVSGIDNLRKNALYATYDGVKWLMSAYDLDSTLGATVYAKGWHPVKTHRTQFYEAANGSTKHRLFELIYKYSHDKLKARYAELRSTVLSDENVWYVLQNFVNDIPRAVYNADAERWPTMLGTTTANVENYMQYYQMHTKLLDKEMED